MKSFVISKRDAGTRVDRFIEKTFESVPKSLMYKEIRKRILKLIKSVAQMTKSLMRAIYLNFILRTTC